MLRMIVSIQLLLLMLYLHQKRRKPRTRVSNASGTRSISYDYARRRFEKKVVTTKGGITTHHRYLYRGYLQIAAVNLKADASTPNQWFLIWDPTQSPRGLGGGLDTSQEVPEGRTANGVAVSQPIATRPLHLMALVIFQIMQLTFLK